MRAFDGMGSMGARVFVILLVGILAAATLAFWVSDIQRAEADRRGRDQRVADRVADMATVLQGAPSELWPALAGPGPEALRITSPGALGGQPDPALERRLAVRLGEEAHPQAFQASGPACAPPGPPPARPEPRLPAVSPPPPSCRLVAVTLADGRRIAMIAPTGPRPKPASAPIGPLYLSILALAAAGLAFGVARVATAPLRRLSVAALELGRDLDRAALTVEGPSEVKLAARAFNAMQGRLKQHLEERTHMLAAISHDLRTPLTRQRLRLDKVSDPELRRLLLEDQAEMAAMVGHGLDLARSTGEAEPLQSLDIDSLLESLADDAVEANAEVRVSGRCGVSIATRPQALRRCVANLLDNALKYAGAAELSASREAGTLVIRVLDRGPGIPPDQMESALRPFFRLEGSRSRETGGVGLGLTIARILAERAGGVLALSNRPGGGLEAQVRLG